MENLCSEEGADHTLLPGLPNDVVLENVAPRIPWITMFTLTAVNQAWRKSIRSREVHHWMKRSSVTQELAVLSVSKDQGLALYDVQHREIHLLPLPPVPLVDRKEEHLVMVDGRIVVIGENSREWLSPSAGERAIAVLNIAACERVWELHSSATSLKYIDILMSCNGKIYVFDNLNVDSAEVFDVANNRWSHIAELPMKEKFYHFSLASSKKNIFCFSRKAARPSLIYSTETETWQVLETTSPCSRSCRLCVVGGTLYRFESRFVQVYSVETNTWAPFQSISARGVGAGEPNQVMPIGSEVLAVLNFSDLTKIIRQSVGFGVEGGSFVWEEVPCSAFQKLDEVKRSWYERFLQGILEF